MDFFSQSHFFASVFSIVGFFFLTICCNKLPLPSEKRYLVLNALFGQLYTVAKTNIMLIIERVEATKMVDKKNTIIFSIFVLQ